MSLLRVTLLLATVISCSTPRARTSGSDRATSSANSDVISAEEIGAAPTGSTVYDVVRQLRPAWLLRSRPTAMLRRNQAQLMIYLDGARYGGAESMRQLSISGVAMIRYYSPGKAEAQFGPGHLLGAIEVKTLPH